MGIKTFCPHEQPLHLLCGKFKPDEHLTIHLLVFKSLGFVNDVEEKKAAVT